jgi:hypothetical protein
MRTQRAEVDDQTLQNSRRRWTECGDMATRVMRKQEQLAGRHGTRLQVTTTLQLIFTSELDKTAFLAS